MRQQWDGDEIAMRQYITRLHDCPNHGKRFNKNADNEVVISFHKSVEIRAKSEKNKPLHDYGEESI